MGDNADHDFICRVGDVLLGSGAQYEILACLGKGGFGQVVKCRSSANQTHVAVKIVKHTLFLSEVALEVETEIRILSFVSLGYAGIVNMLDCFDHAGHMCIVFELLGPNLLEILERDGKPGLPSAFVRHAAEQLLAALHRLREVSVIHGDLKPEN